MWVLEKKLFEKLNNDFCKIIRGKAVSSSGTKSLPQSLVVFLNLYQPKDPVKVRFLDIVQHCYLFWTLGQNPPHLLGGK